jgi:hypothetical protein
MESRVDAHLSTALLLLTTAIYVAVVSALFAALAVTRPTTAQALMDWAKDYGSIIAGLPVLVAIFVAKQQLDASRAQHEANTKLEFKEELDGLQVASDVASSLNTPSFLRGLLFSRKRHIKDSEMETVEKCRSPKVIEAFANLKAIVNDGAKFEREKSIIDALLPEHAVFGDDQREAAKAVLFAIGERKKFLRQFLPTLV